MSFSEAHRADSLKTRRNKSNEVKKAMLEALEKSLGVVTQAARTLGLDREQHYKWMNSDPRYKAKVEELQEVALDFAESKLHQSIQNGSDTATIFFLKTKGKKRGYIERTELEMTGQMSVNWEETKTYEQPHDSDSQTDQSAGLPGGSTD
jgi:Bacterial regulatory protein, Fis family